MSNPNLEQKAVQAMKNSYSPYSNRKVGASILLSNGHEFSGCNVENSSFGGTVCAERVAVWKAVSEEGPDLKIKRVVVATEASPPWSPCGMCRQVINEFAAPDCEIVLINLAGEKLKFMHSELLPYGFARSDLSV